MTVTLEQILTNTAKVALYKLGVDDCSRSIEVVTHEEIGHAEIRVRLDLGWWRRLWFSRRVCVYEIKRLFKLTEVGTHEGLELTVVVDVGQVR